MKLDNDIKEKKAIYKKSIDCVNNMIENRKSYSIKIAKSLFKNITGVAYVGTTTTAPSTSTGDM